MTKKGSIKETGEELPDDQWKQFEAAVDAAVKSGPKHRKKDRSEPTLKQKGAMKADGA